MLSAPRFRACAARALFAALVLALAAPIVAQEDQRQQRVLALYVTTPGAPGALVFDAVYEKVLGDGLGSRLDFYSEYVELARFSQPGYLPALADFLRYKYRQLPPDLILAPTEAARQFVEKFREDLFPGVPVVFIDRVDLSRPPPGMTGVTATLDLGATLDLALTLQPDTTSVVIVCGVSGFDRFYETLARTQLQRFAGKVSLTYLCGQALSDIEQTVAQLPAHSLIYFLTLGEDGAGGRFRTTEVHRRLAALASVPLYSWNAVGMGQGTVGGRQYSNEVAGLRSAEIALRILRGEHPDKIPVVAVDPMVSQLDWRQLRRWGISEARAPQGTTILFREPSLWDRYKWYIGSAAALIVLQAALIAGLLFQRARRQRAELEMREHQATLQASYQQITDLFGRLIGAQEAERTRIARDLHDDVSQRIAALSITISALKRKAGGPDPVDIVGTLTSMQRDTIALADQIRHVTHDLHPGMLQHAGLVSALRTSCDQFEKLHPIAVTCSINDDIGPIDDDTALCLYRITQEALRNVAKHAQARNVTVALARTADGVHLSITDDGKGFDLAGTRGKGGLGLVSIDERVRLQRGSVHIQTRPQGGTRVEVRIPLTA